MSVDKLSIQALARKEDFKQYVSIDPYVDSAEFEVSIKKAKSKHKVAL